MFAPSSQQFMQGGRSGNPCNMCKGGPNGSVCSAGSGMFEPNACALNTDELSFIARAKADALSQMGGGQLAQMFQGMQSGNVGSICSPQAAFGDRCMPGQPHRSGGGGGGGGGGAPMMNSFFTSMPMPDHPTNGMPNFDMGSPQGQPPQNQGFTHGNMSSFLPANFMVNGCSGHHQGSQMHNGFSQMKPWNMRKFICEMAYLF
ncbi:hypothetical protein Ciccas_001722 [Cichlidogyrus casuarinus]|uniref:Uncharacterized protein n=1 Tax=Cichlidogyrus casuarinus TaxID=1844966 RepID=A0ABD2QJB2_9PLAT